MSEEQASREHRTAVRVSVMVWTALYVLVWTFGTLALVSYVIPPWLGAVLLALMFIVPMVFRPQIVRFLQWWVYQ